MIDFTDVHVTRIPHLAYRYEVRGETLIRLGSEAIKRAEELFDQAPFRIESMDVEPAVSEFGGAVSHYRADVLAVAAS